MANFPLIIHYPLLSGALQTQSFRKDLEEKPQLTAEL